MATEVIRLQKPRRGCGSTKFLMNKVIDSVTNYGDRWFIYSINPTNIKDQLKRLLVERLKSKKIEVTVPMIDDFMKYVKIEKYDDSRIMGMNYQNSNILLSDFDSRQNLHTRVYSDLVRRPSEVLIIEMDTEVQYCI
jgi:hypothetical protein